MSNNSNSYLVGERPENYDVRRDISRNVQSDTFWFYADSAYGKIYIGLFKEAESTDLHMERYPQVLSMASGLRNAEKALRIIEEWLECGLMLRPASIIPATIHKISISIKSHLNANELNKVVLGIQDEVIRYIPSPKGCQIETADLDYSTVKTDVILSNMYLSQKEVSTIEKGCIVLIPDSFENSWDIKLQNKNNVEQERQGQLDKDSRTIRFTKIETDYLDEQEELETKYSDSTLKVSGEVDVSVKLANPVSIPLDSLLGWGSETPLVLKKPLRTSDILICTGDTTIATGHLIRVADGFGIYVD